LGKDHVTNAQMIILSLGEHLFHIGTKFQNSKTI